MSESVFDKINNLSNERKPRELKRLEEWQRKLIVEYYPAIDYEELIELLDAPKSTITGIAQTNGVKRFRGKAEKKKYLKNKKPLKERAKALELAYQDKLDALQEEEEQKRIEKELEEELQNKEKRQAKLKKMQKIVDGYNDEGLLRLSEEVTKTAIEEYKKHLESEYRSEYTMQEIERLEDWFVNSSLCLLDGGFIIDECRKVANLADKERT